MWWAILIVVGFSTLIVFFGTLILKSSNHRVPNVAHNNHGKDIKKMYDNLKKNNISLKFDFNKRTQDI